MSDMSAEEMRGIAKEALIYGWPLCENYNVLYASWRMRQLYTMVGNHIAHE